MKDCLVNPAATLVAEATAPSGVGIEGEPDIPCARLANLFRPACATSSIFMRVKPRRWRSSNSTETVNHDQLASVRHIIGLALMMFVFATAAILDLCRHLINSRSKDLEV